MVPCGALFGAQHLASGQIRAARVCTNETIRTKENSDPKIAVNPNSDERYGFSPHQPASTGTTPLKKYSPTGLEPVTFGSGRLRPAGKSRRYNRLSLLDLWQECKGCRQPAKFHVF